MTTPAPLPAAVAPTPSRRASASSTLLLAAWFGVAAGLSESALLAAARFVLGRYTHVGPHIVWMGPAAYTIAFAALGLLLWTLTRAWPRLPLLPGLTLLFGTLAGTGSLLLFTRVHPAASLVLSLGVALRLAAFVRDHPARTLRLVRWTLPVLAGLAIAGGVTVHLLERGTERRTLAAAGVAPAGTPNVLIIILDTVRALSLSLYEHTRPTSPQLEALARQGVVFDQAMSPSSWTLPTHASVFTGRWPSELRANWTAGLDGETPTLAEALLARGYVTAGVVANTYYLGPESGIRRGFAYYQDFVVEPGLFVASTSLGRWLAYHRHARTLLGWYEVLHRQSADDINDAVLRLIDTRRDGRPFFVFANYFDAHEPYLPPAPFAGRYAPRLPGYNPLLWVERRPPADELRDLENAYDEAITYLDDRIGRLMAELDRRGLLDSTLIVITSDHGEEFGEHGLISHGYSLYRPSLHVPLLVRLPGRTPAGLRVAKPVSLRDVAATVLDLTGSGDAGFPGRSLARFWADSAARADTLYAEVRYASGLPADFPVSHDGVRSLMTDSLQYIATGRGAEQLFDIVTDPRQQRDLGADPASAGGLERFRTSLTQWPSLPQ